MWPANRLRPANRMRLAAGGWYHRRLSPPRLIGWLGVMYRQRSAARNNIMAAIGGICGWRSVSSKWLAGMAALARKYQ